MLLREGLPRYLREDENSARELRPAGTKKRATGLERCGQSVEIEWTERLSNPSVAE